MAEAGGKRARIAFVRGVGGGIRSLPMAAFRQALENDGLTQVRTYIASGNVVFDAPPRSTTAALSKRIAAVIAAGFGFDPLVVVLTLDELERAASRNPYPSADAVPTSLHVCFLDAVPTPKLDEMNRIKTASESFTFDGQVLYLHTPDGFGISKLAEKIDRLVGVPLTARNWRTIGKMIEMARG